MTRAAKVLSAVLLVMLGTVAGGLYVLIRHGVSAHDQPTAVEGFIARRVRRLATPQAAREAQNPVPQSSEVLAEARAHFADHCASCHGNDGRGRTTIGQNLYPKVPDMWKQDSQSLTDGEIFYIIKNGIRLTGMPAWGKDTRQDDLETWHLVHFIRHLPKITPDEVNEMESLNPKGRNEFEEEEEARKFLEGGDAPSASPSAHASH